MNSTIIEIPKNNNVIITLIILNCIKSIKYIVNIKKTIHKSINK